MQITAGALEGVWVVSGASVDSELENSRVFGNRGCGVGCDCGGKGVWLSRSEVSGSQR